MIKIFLCILLEMIFNIQMVLEIIKILTKLSIISIKILFFIK